MEQADLLKKLNEFLTELDASSAPTDEMEIQSTIKALSGSETAEPYPAELQAEYLAFSFRENCADKNSSQGTYYGSQFVFKRDDGSVVEFPSASSVTPEFIAYWLHRIDECENALLKARYCGLVWEFTRLVTGRAPSHNIAREYIASLLLVANSNLHKHSTDTVRKLERALSIALSLRDEDLVSECKNTIMEYERQVAQDDKPGLWGFSFDLLIDGKKADLSATEESRIISDLESRLENLCVRKDTTPPDPWKGEQAAERLARYYRGQDKTDEVIRVLNKLECAWDDVLKGASSMMACGLFEKLYSTYLRFDLYEQADSIAARIRQLGPGAVNDLREVSHSVQFTRDEIKGYVEAMVEGEVEHAIRRIVVSHLPRQEETKARVLALGEDGLQSLFTTTIVDHKGRAVASIGNLKDDMEGHVAKAMASDMNFYSLFVGASLAGLIEKFSLDTDTLVGLVGESPIFNPEKQGILECGLNAYLIGDYVVAAHLLVPQIEDAIRELIETQGGAVFKRRRNGGFLLKTFDELLRDKMVREVLGEDLTAYLRVLFTDQRGWNLRNDICHGVLPAEAFCKPMADRIIHALLCLSLLRRTNDS